ncbi:HDIG domain-containing protein [Candidatus Sumerlaeota bacterium]|nr:HDIG domain-containing protein [Candidatus Sumerlaeota bacterium]
MKNLIKAYRNWRSTLSLRDSAKRHDSRLRWFLVALIIALLMLICSQTLTGHFRRIAYESGQPAPERILAPFPLRIEDSERLERDQLLALESAPVFCSSNDAVAAAAERRSRDVVDLIEQLALHEDSLSSATLIQQATQKIKQIAAIPITEDQARRFAAILPNERFRRLTHEAIELVLKENSLLSQPFYNRISRQPRRPILLLPSGKKLDRSKLIDEGDLPQFLDQYRRERFKQGTVEWEFNELLLTHLLKPNLIYNIERTELAEETVRQNVPHYMLDIEIRTVIAPEGQIINPRIQSIIDAYNAKMTVYRVEVFICHLLVIIAIVFFIALYLRKFLPHLPMNSHNIMVAALPTILMLLIARVAIEIDSYVGAGEYGALFYLSGAVGILGAVMLDSRLALIQVIAGAILLGLFAQADPLFSVLFAIFSGFTAVASLYTVRKRSDILRTGLWISGVNVLLYLVYHFVNQEPGAPPDDWKIIWSLINGLLCSIATYPTLVACESVLGVLTDFKLLELTGATHPALKDLEEKAPGSYQHSLSVTKLAESAAEAIGANHLLVRAGGYFHDLGKMLKPKYYSENQVTEEERKIHHDLSPHMSCLIIKNHVKEGIEMARNVYKLPEAIIDFIPQHHGTSLIQYFYTQAQRAYENSDQAQPVIEEEFRYPGPKPQSIETAVLMLADSVEATATSKLTGKLIRDDDIRRLVRDAIETKFRDGQFSETPLTLQDLSKIGDSFAKSLRARYHFRVDYPAKDKGKN